MAVVPAADTTSAGPLSLTTSPVSHSFSGGQVGSRQASGGRLGSTSGDRGTRPPPPQPSRPSSGAVPALAFAASPTPSMRWRAGLTKSSFE